MTVDDAAGTDAAWRLLLAAAAARRAGTLPAGPCGLHVDGDGTLAGVAADDPRAALLRRDADAADDASGAFVAGPALDATAREFVELYLPLLGRGDGRPTVVAHLGQSADARIASRSGDSRAVTGRADFVHMHRLRALADAVVVGAGTVAADDPRLTVRLVEGPSPLRVVLDPRGRLDDSFGLFRDDGPPTLLVTIGEDGAPARAGRVRTLEVPALDGELSLPAVLDALGERGVRVVFVEGGGVTVARWMAAGLLDRLHLAASPLLIGEARAALPLPAAETMDDAWRPAYRLYRLGRDVLWDLDLRSSADEDDAERDGTPRRLL